MMLQSMIHAVIIEGHGRALTVNGHGCSWSPMVVKNFWCSNTQEFRVVFEMASGQPWYWWLLKVSG